MFRSHADKTRVAAFVFLVCIISAVGWLESAAAYIINRQSAVVDILSDYVSGRDDVIARAIKKVGYSPQMGTTWDAFPAIRKLEQMYKSAEAAAPGGGNRALASVASILAKDFDSLRNNSTIQTFVAANDAVGTIQFAKSAASLSFVSNDAHRIIVSLASVAEGQVGGYVKVITADFGLSEQRAYTILAEANTGSQALTRALGEVEEGQRNLRLSNFVGRMTRLYPSLAFEPTILAFQRSVRTSSKIEDMLEKMKRGNRSIMIDPTLDSGAVVKCYCDGVYIGMRTKAACSGPC